QAGHWKLNNASNNGAFLTCLQDIYLCDQPTVVFHAEDSQIACFPHIINICVQHTIKVLNNNIDPNLEDNNTTHNNDYILTDLLSKVWSLVKAIRASGQHQAAFNQVVLSGNSAGWWKDENEAAILIKPLKFLRNVRTRWDSTYQMLVRIQIFRQLLDQFLSLGSSSDIEKFCLSAVEWIHVTDIIGILQYLHSVQQVLSKEKTMVLVGIIPTFEHFMMVWETLTQKNPHLRNPLNVGLSFATKYYGKMDSTKAYVIAMCEWSLTFGISF
ncbi:hypothetical protein L208DRAFT_1341594, partial [Tricholoma matsutake]